MPKNDKIKYRSEKNGLVLNIIGGYFLFSFITGLAIRKEIIGSLEESYLLQAESIYWVALMTNGLIAFLLLFAGIRRYIYFRYEKQEYIRKKQKEKNKK